MAAKETASSAAYTVAWLTPTSISGAVPAWDSERAARVDAEGAAQCGLLRDLFGNPFAVSPVEPTWLTWADGTVPKLARPIYEERNLPGGTLDGARLAVLADALEEAGCTDPTILEHCRSGEHVRGCWLVDALLRKK
jgi:hypothetical protein